jgi:hypothetical protein
MIRFAPVAFAWIAILAAAGAAAVIAHVAIDIVANFLVAHDPYDDLSHHSRFTFLAGSLTIALVGASAVLWAALRDVRVGGDSIRTLVGEAAASTPWRFISCVAATAAAALLAMEWLDSLADTGRFCTLTDALGGSIAIGTAVVLAVAIAIGFAAWKLLRQISAYHREIANAIGAILVGVPARTVRPTSTQPTPDQAPLIASILARRAGKRAPPLAA